MANRRPLCRGAGLLAGTALAAVGLVVLTPPDQAVSSSAPTTPSELLAVPPDVLSLGAAPRITLLAQQASPISGAIGIPPDDARITYRGADGFAFGASYPDTLMYVPSSRYPHGYGSQTAFGLTFSTDAPVFELFFKQKPAGMYRLSIDGRRTTALPQATGASVPGGLYRLRFDFGSAATREIGLDLFSVPVGGINLPAGTTFSKVTSPEVRWAVLGDSISGGSNMNAGFAQGTWVNRFALLTGWRDAFNESLGETGFVNAGSSAVFGDRVQDDVVAHRPQQVVVWGGFNDLQAGQSAISAAASSVLSRIRAGLPGSTVLLVGCWSPTGSPGTALRSVDATLRAVAVSAGVAFSSPITGTVYDRLGSVAAQLGPWITGTGNAGAPAGNGNADRYVGSDRAHPTDAGHSHLAMKLAASVAAVGGGSHPGAGVRISWSGSVTGDGSTPRYEVHRSTSATFTPQAATLVGTTTATSLEIPAHEPGTSWYRVVATDGAGLRSTPSSAVPATVVDDTNYPSTTPTPAPTTVPTTAPTTVPTTAPTTVPTTAPTTVPTTAPKVAPTVVSLVPTADTYVKHSRPSVNYGRSSSLGARSRTRAAAYLRFAIPRAPAGKKLTAATLRIRTDNRVGAGSTDTYRIRLTTAAWSETRLTWNNRPVINGPTLGRLTGARRVDVAVTATLAPAGLAGRGGTAVTLVLVSSSSSEDLLKFRSRNSATASARPLLKLTYS